MVKVDLCETILCLKCSLSYAALGLCLEILLFVAFFFEKFVCFKVVCIRKTIPEMSRIQGISAYKELPAKWNDDVIVDANVCVEHQLNGNLKHRQAKDPRVFALSVCRECACLEEKGVNGNTTCPLYADINKKDICTVMSYLQNGPKRPTSESFDVACKVGLRGWPLPVVAKYKSLIIWP